MTPENVLRVRKDGLLLGVGDEVGLQDGIGYRLHLRKRGHEGRDVGVVGSEDELGRRHAVAEEAFDLVVEDGAGGVVPESVFGGEGG